MAFLSPSPLSGNAESRENNTGLLLNTISLKSYCQLFLVSIISHPPKQPARVR